MRLSIRSAILKEKRIGCAEEMAIKTNLSRILGERRLKMSELADQAGVAKNTVLTLYHEREKGITWAVLDKLCTALNCQPGDLIEHIPDGEKLKA